MCAISLQKNHRDPIVDDLIEMYEEAAEKGIVNPSNEATKKQKR